MASSYGAKRQQHNQDNLFKICPRCADNLLHASRVRNALSRKDNETYICPPCGTDEGLRDASGQDPWPTFPEVWTAFARKPRS